MLIYFKSVHERQLHRFRILIIVPQTGARASVVPFQNIDYCAANRLTSLACTISEYILLCRKPAYERQLRRLRVGCAEWSVAARFVTTARFVTKTR